MQQQALFSANKAKKATPSEAASQPGIEPPATETPSGEPAVPPPPPPPPQQPGSPGSPGGPPDDEGTVSLLRAARERYLNYALSVITARALPDVRDGLKPVQRRILYAMYANLGLLHTARFRKSAAVVGEVMARFHPHGDQSIYDAMVRMAQGFSLRSPLVEGQGNFGSLDGDPPAAMRYTEARLRALATELVEEIEQDTVPFRANYDGTTSEPVVLPSRIPNLLVNGCQGIAVGMATSIPPHNLREVCRACVRLVDEPEATVEDLLSHIEGPDFPLGGEILNSREDLREIYRGGRGSIRLRATWELEKQPRKRQIVIKSIPWGQVKSEIVEELGRHIAAGKVPQLVDVRDESTDEVRIVCELKRDASEHDAMAYLYKHSALSASVAVNVTVLLPTRNPEVGAPAQVGLLPLLRHFLDFRLVVVRRRLEYELRRLRERIHVLLGFAILFDALDEAITLIRRSDGRKDAAERLKKRFKLDDVQVDAILDLKLYRLARLEIQAIRDELAALEKEATRIESLLSSESALWGVVKEELLDVAKEHGDDRRTLVGGLRPAYDFDPDKYVVHEDAWVIVTRGGWIKRQKGFTALPTIRVREGDEVWRVIRASTRSTLTLFSDQGRAYCVRVDDLTQTTGYGEPVQRHFQFGDGERVVGIASLDERNLPMGWEPTEAIAAVREAEELARKTAQDQGVAEAAAAADLSAAGGSRTGAEIEVDHEGEVEAERETEHETELDPEAGHGVEHEADDGGDPADGDEGASEADAGPVGAVAVAVTRSGKGLLFPLGKHAEPSTRHGRRFVSVSGGDAVLSVEIVTAPEQRLCLATEGGRVLAFPVLHLKLLRGSGKGVRAIKVAATDRVLDFVLANTREEGLELDTTRGRHVVVSEKEYGLGRRGGKGSVVIKRGGLLPIQRPALVIGQKPEELADSEEATPAAAETPAPDPDDETQTLRDSKPGGGDGDGSAADAEGEPDGD
jgi:DNA gyrase subunit A